MWDVLRNGRWAFLHSFTILLFIFSACTKPSGNGQGFSGRQTNTVIAAPEKVQIQKTGEHRLTASAPAGTVRRADGGTLGQITVWNVSKAEIDRISNSKDASVKFSGKLLGKVTPNPDGSFSVDLPSQSDGYLLITVSDSETGDPSILIVPAPGTETTAVFAKIENGAPGAIESVFTDEPVAAVSSAAGTDEPTPAPEITSLSPTGGALGGLTALTIIGKNFTGTTSVLLGGSQCNGLVVTATQITCSTSAHAAGVVNVVVTRSDLQTATLTSGYTYAAAPQISTLSSNAGPLAGGGANTIIGSGFVSGGTVTIGGNQTIGVAGGGGTFLSFTLPAHAAGSVSIQVQNPDGQQSANVANAFTYQAAPTVTNVSPTSGSTTGGNVVTITGTNFLPGATIDFGGSACQNPVVHSASQMTCTTPARSAGIVTISAQNTDAQRGSKPNSYTYTPSTTNTCRTLHAGLPITYISTEADLRAIIGGNQLYIVQNNITLTSNWTPKFLPSGAIYLDGGGYSIINLTVSTLSDMAGMFGQVQVGCISDLRLNNVSVSGPNFVGALIGNISTSGPLTLANIDGTGNINGTDYVGGLVGFETGDQLTTTSLDSHFNVTGQDEVGGLFGHWNARDISGATSHAIISGRFYVGGIAGIFGNLSGSTHTPATLSGLISYADVTGSQQVGGVGGRITFGFTGSATVRTSYSQATIRGPVYVGGFFGYASSGYNYDSGTLTFSGTCIRTSGTHPSFGTIVGGPSLVGVPCL